MYPDVSGRIGFIFLSPQGPRYTRIHQDTLGYIWIPNNFAHFWMYPDVSWCILTYLDVSASFFCHRKAPDTPGYTNPNCSNPKTTLVYWIAYTRNCAKMTKRGGPPPKQTKQSRRTTAKTIQTIKLIPNYVKTWTRTTATYDSTSGQPTSGEKGFIQQVVQCNMWCVTSKMSPNVGTKLKKS